METLREWRIGALPALALVAAALGGVFVLGRVTKRCGGSDQNAQREMLIEQWRRSQRGIND